MIFLGLLVAAAAIGVGVVFMGGMIVTMLGVGRAVRVRRELRDLRDEHEESVTTLEMEKQHLQRELARAPQQAPAPAQAHMAAPQPGGPGSKVSSSRFFDPSS